MRFRLVFVFEFGKFNFKKIREEEEQDFLTFMNSVFAEKLIRTGEKDLQGVAIIMDFDGFTLDSFNSARGKHFMCGKIKAFITHPTLVFLQP